MSTRVERLERNIQEVKTRRAISFPFERALMIAGGLLATLGLVFILLAWSGASRTPYLFEQVPYLISGAIGGLALVVLGGLLYFAYWMTKNVHATQAQSDVMQQTLQRIEELMAARPGAATGAPVAVPAAKSNGKPYVTTAKGSMFHRPDCVVVSDKGDLKAVAGTEKDLVPCKICDPLALSAV